MASKAGWTVTIVALCMLAMTETSYAYIDPGSGSFFLQILFGGVAGAVVLAKVYWTSLRSRLGFPVRKGEGVPDEQTR